MATVEAKKFSDDDKTEATRLSFELAKQAKKRAKLESANLFYVIPNDDASPHIFIGLTRIDATRVRMTYSVVDLPSVIEKDSMLDRASHSVSSSRMKSSPKDYFLQTSFPIEILENESPHVPVLTFSCEIDSGKTAKNDFSLESLKPVRSFVDVSSAQDMQYSDFGRELRSASSEISALLRTKKSYAKFIDRQSGRPNDEIGKNMLQYIANGIGMRIEDMATAENVPFVIRLIPDATRKASHAPGYKSTVSVDPMHRDGFVNLSNLLADIAQAVPYDGSTTAELSQRVGEARRAAGRTRG